MPLSDKLKAMFKSAWDDGYPFLLATAGPGGPHIGPKGSMIVYDDNHLAYLERTKGAILDDLRRDNRVCVLYANLPAQRAGQLDSGYLRFYGTAELHESGPVRDRIFSMLHKREQDHAGADTGIGVLITITHAADLRGKPIL
ncbi:MAG: pyridoxamine 5'-phosphate oxidase family protein [Pseudolabrys sp.]